MKWIALGFAAFVASAADAQTSMSELLPAVEPQEEMAAPDDPEFAAACLSQMQSRFAPGNYEFGRPLFTQSVTWGLIVRIDYDKAGVRHDPTRFHRIVCFRKPGAANVSMGAYDGIPVDPAEREGLYIVIHPRQ